LQRLIKAQASEYDKVVGVVLIFNQQPEQGKAPGFWIAAAEVSEVGNQTIDLIMAHAPPVVFVEVSSWIMVGEECMRA